MDWTYNTIWKDQLPPGKHATIAYERNRSITTGTAGATYFDIHKFKTKAAGFHELNGVGLAEYVEVHLSNITSFLEVSRLGRLKRLELIWCLKLESDAGLSEIKDSLEWLHINTSKKFSPRKDLFELRNLKVLCLNGCGPLDNLRFLEQMPKLVDFRFVDTNVIDGDLTPLTEHPSLVNAGFFNKRHYNLKSEEIAEHFKGKHEIAKEYAHKGEFQTFRYKAFGDRNDI